MKSVQRSRADPNRFARELFAPLGDRYDFLAELLSFGQNRRWRKAMVGKVVISRPPLALDVATGTGGVAIQLAEARTSVVGIDLTEQMIRRGTDNAARRGLGTRIDFVVGRAERLPFGDESFDALTFTYLLRYVDDPAATLQELARVVKPGGVVASLEFLSPPNPLFRLFWFLYTRLLLPAAGALFGRQWFEVGRFLGPSISDHYRRFPIDWHVHAWEEAGIERIGLKKMSFGGGILMWGIRKDGRKA